VEWFPIQICLIFCFWLTFVSSEFGVAMQVGQKVKLCRLRDRTSQDVIQHLGKIGIIKGLKPVDGKGIGLVVEFEDQFKTWFFEDELQAAD
jgi:hypothetical protein